MSFTGLGLDNSGLGLACSGLVTGLIRHITYTNIHYNNTNEIIANYNIRGTSRTK